MENMKIMETTTQATTNPIRDPKELLDALYWCLDAFDRANIPFFLIKQTYHDACAGRSLSGDKVEIGIKESEWSGGGKRVLDAFITPEKTVPGVVTYIHNGTPVVLSIYPDDECIIALDSLNYRYEWFKTPNPYSRFEKLYLEK